MPKVLIVEDELLIAQDVTEIVEKAGHVTAPVAKTAMDAVRLATVHQPDIVLMDIKLGSGSDGVEAATYIAQELALPIIFLTSMHDEATLERAKGASPYGFLSKPVRESDVVSNITMALHQHAQQRQNQADDENNDTLRGRIEMVGGINVLLEMIKSLHNQGALRFDDGAVLYVKEGKVVHVSHPKLEPEPALTRLLQRGKGTFYFDPSEVSDVRSLSRDITTLLLNMAKESDETARDKTAPASASDQVTPTPDAPTPDAPTPDAPATLAGYPFDGEVVLEKRMGEPYVRGDGVVSLPDKQRLSEFKAALKPVAYVGTAKRDEVILNIEADVRVSNMTEADAPLALECQFASTGLTVNVLN